MTLTLLLVPALASAGSKPPKGTTRHAALASVLKVAAPGRRWCTRDPPPARRQIGATNGAVPSPAAERHDCPVQLDMACCNPGAVAQECCGQSPAQASKDALSWRLPRTLSAEKAARVAAVLRDAASFSPAVCPSHRDAVGTAPHTTRAPPAR